MADPPTFKVILAGERGVGKTAFMQQLRNCTFKEQYSPTAIGELYKIELDTTEGPVRFEVWEVSNWEKIESLGVDLSAAHATILMVERYKARYAASVSKWCDRIHNVGGRGNSTPLVICRNKIDKRDGGAGYSDIKKQIASDEDFAISAKTLENIDEPFIWLARKLTGNWDLDYSSSKAYHEKNMDQERVVKSSEEIPEWPIKSSGETDDWGIKSSEEVNDWTNQGSPQNVLETPKSWWTEDTPQNHDFANLSVRDFDEDEWTPHESSDVANENEPINNQDIDAGIRNPRLFVLCMGCMRMISIHFSVNANLSSDFLEYNSFSLVTTTCRACNRQFGFMESEATLLKLSPKVVKYTRMYDCACKVAGEEVNVLTTRHMTASWVSVEELAEDLSDDCRVYGIDTSDATLKKLDGIEKDNLVMPYLPGAFF